MSIMQSNCGRLLLGLALVLSFLAPGSAAAQVISDEMVGQPPELLAAWENATRAVAREQLEEAGQFLQSVTDLSPSNLRLALMADRSGSLRLEAWAKSEDAPQTETSDSKPDTPAASLSALVAANRSTRTCSFHHFQETL